MDVDDRKRNKQYVEESSFDFVQCYELNEPTQWRKLYDEIGEEHQEYKYTQNVNNGC